MYPPVYLCCMILLSQVWEASDGLASFPPEYLSLFASPALRAKIELHNGWSRKQHKDQYVRYNTSKLSDDDINIMQVSGICKCYFRHL